MTSPAEPTAPDIVHGTAAGRRPTLTLDVALYDRYLEDSGLAEADRHALLEDLWAIIVGFVDLGFAVAPATEGQDEPFSAREELADSVTDLVEYGYSSTTKTFRKAAVRARPKSVETRE